MDLFTLSHTAFGWRDAVDVLLVTILFYNIIIMLKETRSLTAIYGLFLIILAYFVSRTVGLNALNWLLENFLSSLFLLVVILFQRDIRHALSSIGARQWWLPFRRKKPDTRVLDVICGAALYMAQRKIGALIVIERNMPLGDTTERGVRMNAHLSLELLINMFWPNSPLHDGAALIKGDTIVAGGCILPLSTAVAKRDYGTRHRAALGITEESDAVVVVVSEERGAVAVAVDGRLTAALDEPKLRRVLASALERKL